ncbi:hypothetical protein CVT25_015691 [Psilocybe cyanescens]|uniref:Uncharacterized protein n=1 Tax=Psilocybe cyanescens TaxID=93625 RepID=A0A409XJM6_PSICY|nr:hypothetical protein CVT25_015691 [Psilocybe cyanescens]
MVYFNQIWDLSDLLADDLSASVPTFLFSPLFDQIEVGSVRPQSAQYGPHSITGTPYLRMVEEFLNDPSRAGPHAVNQSTYTAAAVVGVQSAVKAWNETKFTLGKQCNFIWDALAFMLSKAGYSHELVNTLGQQNLTFNLGSPDTDVRHRMMTLWSGYPSDDLGHLFTDDDLYNNSRMHQPFYIDESILSSDEDVQERAA